MSINELESKCRELRQLQSLIDEAQAEADSIRDAIKAAMGASESMTAGEYRLFEKGQSFFGLPASGSVCLQMTVPAGTVPAVVTIVGAYSRHPCPNSRYLFPCSSTRGNSFKTSIDHPFKFFDDFSMLFLRWRLWPSLKRLV